MEILLDLWNVLFGMGLGNGFINSYLSSKWDWVTQTNKRVTVGIIATLLYTIPLVLTVDYIAFVMIDGDDPRNF